MKSLRHFLLVLTLGAVAGWGWTVLGQSTPASYNLDKPLPASGALPGTFIKPGSPYGPANYNSIRPATWDVLVGGGYRSLGTTSERDAIPADWRKEGMVVWVAADNKLYKLASNLTTWIDLGVWIGGGDGVHPVVGTIYSYNDTQSITNFSGNWTAVGSATSATNVVTISGGTTSYGNYFRFNGAPHCWEDWTMVVDVVAPSTLTDGSAITLGVASTAGTFPVSNWGVFTFDAATPGRARIGVLSPNTGNAFQQSKASANGLTLAGGNTVRITLTRAKSLYSLTAENLTQTSANQLGLVLQWGDNDNTQTPHNVGRFAIGILGSVTYTIKAITIQNDTPSNPYLTVIGDSITSGMRGGSSGNRVIPYLGTNYVSGRYVDWLGRLTQNTTAAYAGSGNTTGDIISSLVNLTNNPPRYAVIMAGVNDVAAGTAVGTIASNLGTIRTALLSAGVGRVLVCTPPPGSALAAMKDLRTQIRSTFTTDAVDIYAAVNDGNGNFSADLSDDNLHPNAVGMEVIARLIRRALPY